MFFPAVQPRERGGKQQKKNISTESAKVVVGYVGRGFSDISQNREIFYTFSKPGIVKQTSVSFGIPKVYHFKP